MVCRRRLISYSGGFEVLCITFLLIRSTFKKGRNMYIKIGDKDVEYSKNFRLFLHTKLSKPHYPPEVQAETTLITFAVTEQASYHVTVRRQLHTNSVL